MVLLLQPPDNCTTYLITNINGTIKIRQSRRSINFAGLAGLSENYLSIEYDVTAIDNKLFFNVVSSNRQFILKLAKQNIPNMGGFMKRKWLEKQNGQSMVELALTLPILLLILAGILDFGWIYSNKLITSYCSREGARYASVNASTPGITDLIENKVKSVVPGFLANTITVTSTFTNQTDKRNGDVIVDVSCKFTVLTPIASIFTGEQDYTVNSKCVMKVE